MENTLPLDTLAQQPAAKNTKEFPYFGLVLSIFSVIIVIALVLSAYFYFDPFAQQNPVNNENTKKAISESPGTIQLGVGLWPGNIGFYVANENGYFKDENLDVNLRVYESLSEESADYSNGVLHGRGNLTIDAVSEARAGIDHKVILAVDNSNGADGIVAAPGIENFKDIKGKKVALELGTIEEFFFRYALEQNSMTMSDITPVNLDPEKSAEALISKDVDVAVTYEPYLGNAVKEANANIIFSSKDAPGLITDILTFKSDFINKYPESTKALLRAYFKGLDYVKQYPDDAYSIAAKYMNDEKENVKLQLETLVMLDLKDNSTAFAFAPGLQSVYANLKKSNDFLLEQNTQGVDVDTEKLVEPSFIKDLSQL